MDKADQEFIREYCQRYGVETTPGPGAPRLNGVVLTEEALHQLFAPAEYMPTQLFYSPGKIELSKKRKSKESPSGRTVPISYRNMHRDCEAWNMLQMDKLVS